MLPTVPATKHATGASLSFAERLAVAPRDATALGGGKRKPATRDNKNRPQELSSKRPVKRFRVAAGLSAEDASKKQIRDPRFDALAAGEAESSAWRSRYAFLTDKRRQEAQEIQERLDRSAAAGKKRGRNGAQRQRLHEQRLSPDEEERLRAELSRMQNQLRAHDQMEQRQRTKSSLRKEEVAAVKAGKRPFFVKPAALKEQELVSQYEQLRSSGQLEKFMAKKRRRHAAKAHKLIPRERR
jgi:ribosomal RNA-processing protein 36